MRGITIAFHLDGGERAFNIAEILNSQFDLGGCDVLVKPMQTVEVDLDADNPGQWMTHCHNVYHQERGMMTTLSYRA